MTITTESSSELPPHFLDEGEKLVQFISQPRRFAVERVICRRNDVLVFARPSFYRDIFLVDSQAMAKAPVGLFPRVVSATLASTPKPGAHDLVRLAPSQCRHFHRAPPRQEEKLSFRGQLYESTAQRLARERAEEARFAATRSAQGNSTLRLFATTFCMRDPPTTAGA
jgi:hypothetical protein